MQFPKHCTAYALLVSSVMFTTIVSCASNNPESFLFPDSLKLPLAEGDAIIADCRSEFDGGAPITDRDLQDMVCIQPSEGQHKKSWRFYETALGDRNDSSEQGNPQSGRSISYCSESGTTVMMVLSNRVWQIISWNSAMAWSDTPDEALSKEELDRRISEISNSLPIAINHQSAQKCGSI